MLQEILIKLANNSMDEIGYAKTHKKDINQALSAIKEEILGKLPIYKRDWEDEPAGALFGFKKAVEEFRQVIEEECK